MDIFSDLNSSDNVLVKLSDIRADLSRVFNGGQSRIMCFNEGTCILCLSKDFNDIWIPVENLTENTYVKTYKHGYRKIKAILKGKFNNDINNFSQCMYKMKIHHDTNDTNNTNELFSELIITGSHSILVDDMPIDEFEENKSLFNDTIVTIDNKYLLLAAVSNDFEKIKDNNEYNYYHFILENEGDKDVRYGIWANGILTETPSEEFFFKDELSSSSEKIEKEDKKEDKKEEYNYYHYILGNGDDKMIRYGVWSNGILI